MPRVDEESKLTKAAIALREWLPTVKPSLQNRYAPVKETPLLIWSYPEVRYAGYFCGALLLMWLAQSCLARFQTVSASELKPFATTGDFHVICTNASCRKQFVINRKFKFRKFPVTCPHCRQTSGARAMRCRSQTCAGKLVPTEIRQGAYTCLKCEKVIKKK